MSNNLFRVVVDETVARVNSLITDETILASNLRTELRQLLELLTQTRPVLLDAEEKHNTANAGDLRDYLFVRYLLREVPQKAEEVIDELAYEILSPKVTQFNFLKKLIFNLKFVYKVKILNQTLQKSNFLIGAVRGVRFDVKFISDTVLANDPIIGREDDASKIVNLLTRSSDQRVLTVVPIVGMCGLGKTALAKFVCRRVMPLNLFDVKMWVCVSENCDELKVLNQMLRSLNATTGRLSLTNKDEILQHLEKELVTRKFLLVLDDICEDMSRFWDDFRTLLLKICRNNGNAVLVTTRSEKVAFILETSSQHRHTLHHLSGDDCWFILKERAFRNVTVESNLAAIARDIARKCRGVPLAAKVLGGTLGFNRDEEAWLKIRDSDVLKLKARNNEENLKWILQLCFDHLPSCLKPCFAICSVFPKGILIVKEDLIQLWIVERLVASYDIGNEYFHALLANSFFQVVECEDDGTVIKCKMLNIAPYLALHLDIFKISGNYLYVDYQSIRTSEGLRKNKAENLHTIILNGVLFQCSYNSKSLCTLYLNTVDMKNLPSAISRLKHFKYIHVSNTNISPLRESVPHMYMLQILTLSNCSCKQLPLLGDLPFLKFLRISHMKKVKFIGNESYEVNNSPRKLRLFPALKSLSLSWMENLIAWSPPSHGNRVVIFPQLQNLSIRCCAKLACFPMRDLSALVKVELKDCEELRFLFDEHKSFPTIRIVSIVGCPKLTYL